MSSRWFAPLAGLIFPVAAVAGYRPAAARYSRAARLARSIALTTT